MSCIQVYVSENTSRINFKVDKLNNINLDAKQIKDLFNLNVIDVSTLKLQVLTNIEENTIIQPNVTLYVNPIEFSYGTVCIVNPVVPSCFGAGYWIGTSPWIGKIAWKGK